MPTNEEHRRRNDPRRQSTVGRTRTRSSVSDSTDSGFGSDTSTPAAQVCDTPTTTTPGASCGSGGE